MNTTPQAVEGLELTREQKLFLVNSKISPGNRTRETLQRLADGLACLSFSIDWRIVPKLIAIAWGEDPSQIEVVPEEEAVYLA